MHLINIHPLSVLCTFSSLSRAERLHLCPPTTHSDRCSPCMQPSSYQNVRRFCLHIVYSHQVTKMFRLCIPRGWFVLTFCRMFFFFFFFRHFSRRHAFQELVLPVLEWHINRDGQSFYPALEQNFMYSFLVFSARGQNTECRIYCCQSSSQNYEGIYKGRNYMIMSSIIYRLPFFLSLWSLSGGHFAATSTSRNGKALVLPSTWTGGTVSSNRASQDEWVGGEYGTSPHPDWFSLSVAWSCSCSWPTFVEASAL